MPNLTEVGNNILLAYSADLIDEEECVLLYDIDRSKKPDLPYWEYPMFDLEDNLNEDQRKSEFRIEKNYIPRLHLKNINIFNVIAHSNVFSVYKYNVSSLTSLW